jgi:prepilin-type N-terminal cleavage/methylation domain-containing protein
MIAKKKKLLKSNGFTLIEVLVVAGLLVVVAVVISNMFFTTFRSSTKTKALTTVKQNGDYTLAVMERLIRGSQEVTSSCPEVPPAAPIVTNNITIKMLNGDEIVFSCDLENKLIASNGANLTSDQVKLDNCSFECRSQGEFYPQVVTIDFTLSQANEAVREEERAKVDFETTVVTRNY